MKSAGLSASRLRLVLILAMFMILATAAGGFYYVQKALNDYAVTITKLNADAQSGDQNILTLQKLKNRLSQENDTIQRARSVVTDNGKYNDQVINDLTQIAKSSGTTITGLEFSDAPVATGAPSTGAAATTTPSTPATALPSGIIKKTVVVSIGSPLSYNAMVKFLQGVEINPLKMQLTNVSIGKDKGDNVTTGPLSIEVYVRQ